MRNKKRGSMIAHRAMSISAITAVCMFAIIFLFNCSTVSAASVVVVVSEQNGTAQFSQISDYAGTVAAPSVETAPTHFLTFTDAQHHMLATLGIALSQKVMQTPQPSWFNKTGRQIYFPKDSFGNATVSIQRTLAVPANAVYLDLVSASGTVIHRYNIQSHEFACVSCGTSRSFGESLLGFFSATWLSIVAKIVLPLACLVILLAVINWRRKRLNPIPR